MAIDERSVRESAALLALPIEDAALAPVAAVLRHIESVAHVLLDAELGPDDELGPVWRP